MKSSKIISSLGNSLINILPFMTSTAAAITVWTQAKDYEGIGVVIAAIYSIVLEILGTGSITMIQHIDKHNKDYPAKKNQVEKWPIWLIYIFQLIVSILVVIGLDLQWKTLFIQVFFILLSIPGGVLFSLNYRISTIQEDYAKAKEQRKRDKQNVQSKQVSTNVEKSIQNEFVQNKQTVQSVKSVQKQPKQNVQPSKAELAQFLNTYNEQAEQPLNVQNPLDKNEQKLLDLISENGNKTKEDYAELMGVSRGTIYNIQKRLVEKHRLTQDWEIVEKN